MSHAKQHPTGLAGLLTSAVILIALRFHVEITAEEAAVLGGLVTTVVSIFTPRRV